MRAPDMKIRPATFPRTRMPRDLRETQLPDATPADGLARQIGDWLIRDARLLDTNREVLEEFCERVANAGVPIDRVSLHQRAFHPQYRGVSRIWRPDRALEELYLDHGIEKTATYLESPVRGVIEDRSSYEWRLDGNAALPFPMLDELRDRWLHPLCDRAADLRGRPGQRPFLGDPPSWRVQRCRDAGFPRHPAVLCRGRRS